MAGRTGHEAGGLWPHLRRARAARHLGWHLALGLGVGVALLALVARDVPPGLVWVPLRQADPWLTALALLTVLLTTAAKVGRWWVLFPVGSQPPLPALGRALLVGQAVNALLPARLGEVTRVYLISRAAPTSMATALGTVAAEKWFDVLLLLVCAALASGLAALPGWLGVSLVALAAGGLLAFLLAVLLSRPRVLAWSQHWLSRLPGGVWLGAVLQQGVAGLVALRQPRPAALAFAWSAAAWALAASTNYVLFSAFGLRLSVGAALALLVLLQVGVAPPSSPGRLGVFHALTVVALTAFGVERPVSLAYATVLHLVVYVPQIVLGGISGSLDGWSRRRAANAGNRSAD